MFRKIFEDYGLKFQFISMNNLDIINSTINKNTKLIWIETPTNPMMNIIDIKSIVDIVKGKDILVAVDNTFASSYIQQPLILGADIVCIQQQSI